MVRVLTLFSCLCVAMSASAEEKKARTPYMALEIRSQMVPYREGHFKEDQDTLTKQLAESFTDEWERGLERDLNKVFQRTIPSAKINITRGPVEWNDLRYPTAEHIFNKPDGPLFSFYARARLNVFINVANGVEKTLKRKQHSGKMMGRPSYFVEGDAEGALRAHAEALENYRAKCNAWRADLQRDFVPKEYQKQLVYVENCDEFGEAEPQFYRQSQNGYYNVGTWYGHKREYFTSYSWAVQYASYGPWSLIEGVF